MSQLKTDAPITWCPGCGNFEILNSFEAVLEELKSEGLDLEKVVIVSGIGNHAKIVDYLHVNSFNSIHGRALPVATAIKLADPELKVVCFVGDGDSFAEGLEHLVFAAKRNVDITVIVHDNRSYALATGQSTPTSQLGYMGRTMPYGAKEEPFNPLALMLASGATYIARAYPVKKQHFRKLLKEAILHKGFSFIDALQVCITFNNLYESYNENVKEVEISNPEHFEEALEAIREWDYHTSKGPIAIGRFYETDKPCFEDGFARLKAEKEDGREKLQSILEKFI
ncbi:thiamine pyrophosphate-dependent enzyme [Parasporobacterium paucivorans]|uniref:2-oxoglutarate ferredoxin oxidoreductase subunit beta n=1 Tax=Parasporobacterium paucivorans DSM 15970 TaxID=1122934 RepID=A0A1M6IYN0_9FIRM|nr:thiamine pyrophosphate-dependent enzyme [Parasporobacterium paucivorans]SHJ39535.1 2-oxoglutarate ferredoxin oxidoreductase subunit beta [Parasporobacterium paucivorans DSM 15970]